MKKTKVHQLLQRHGADRERYGREQGKLAERDSNKVLLFPDRDGVVWFGDRPRGRIVTVALPRGTQFLSDPTQYMPREMMITDHRIDFELQVKGIALANGVMVRWADWKPIGPFPVSEFHFPPRF